MAKNTPEPPKVPPIGVKVHTDFEQRKYGIRARARWTDPSSKVREVRTKLVRDAEGAEAFFTEMRRAAGTGLDPGITLADYLATIGDRWIRGIDPTSTGQLYEVGLRLRVVPALGHLPLAAITTGIIDRTIDDWETRYSASVIKNTVAPLVRLLDEALRDDLITVNPMKNRARRNHHKNALVLPTDSSLRIYAIPEHKTLKKLARACAKVHQCYSDHVMLCALLAARGSEVAGLRVGDVDWQARLVTIERQHYPGKGGLVVKQTKGRKPRSVPILKALEPVLRRLTEGRDPDEPLVRGPRGGVLTTATVRDATRWDELVVNLGLPHLTRHGLRHTGATWLADSGIDMYVLKDILGHQSLETTQRYLHPDNRHLADAAKKADRFLSGRGRSARPKPRHDPPGR